jgi:hypothetical protein
MALEGSEDRIVIRDRHGGGLGQRAEYGRRGSCSEEEAARCVRLSGHVILL